MESTGAAKKFEIKKWNAVALWAWDIQTDVCSICRGQLMEPCKIVSICSTSLSIRHRMPSKSSSQ